MGMTCGEVRQILVEIEYGEFDRVGANGEQLDAHLESCAECRNREAAYHEVRADLLAWDDAASQPSRIAFVPMAPPAARHRWNRWGSRATVAASFIVGTILTASVLNLEPRNDTGGWNVSTSLWPRADSPRESPNSMDAGGRSPQAPQELVSETSQATSESTGTDTRASAASVVDALETRLVARKEIGPLATMTGEQFNNYLQKWVRDHGLDLPRPAPTAGDDPAVANQVEAFSDQRAGDFRDHLIQLIAESETRQQQMYAAEIAEMYSNFETQRANDLYLLSSQLGFFQEDTGQQLQLASAYIDYLLSQVDSQPRDRLREPPR